MEDKIYENENNETESQPVSSENINETVQEKAPDSTAENTAEEVAEDTNTAEAEPQSFNRGAYPPPPPHYGQPNPPYSGGAYGSNNSESGEYRYKPPYAAYGANTPEAHHQYNPYGQQTPPPPPPQMKPKKEKKKIDGRKFSTGAIALIIAGCLVISFGAGFGGAWLANKLGGNTVSGNSGTAISDDGTMVIYKSVTVADSEGNEITDDLTLPQVTEAVVDSVVEITTEYTSSYGFYQYVTGGAGSGVIITEDGYVVTNNHVIVDDSGDVADTITVRLRNSVEYEATCVGTDSESDIALLKIQGKEFSCAVVGDSSQLVVGDGVVAVGNPLGELGGTVTDGIISATSREIDVDGTKMTLLQTNVAINPGNSGGGLFNMRGELVGIVNAKSSGTGIEGLGFAIPVNDAMTVVEEIKNHGYVTGRTYIGIQFAEITDSFQAYQYFQSKSTGVYVVEAEKGYNDGVLEYGDRVIAVNGAEISTFDDIKDAVNAAEVGDKLKFSIYRDGKLEEVEVECFEYVPDSVEFEEN